MTYTYDWFSNNIGNWNKWLAKFKEQEHILRFLEIGCFEGMATVFLLENYLTHLFSKITVIDTFKGTSNGDDQVKNIQKNFEENIKPWKDNVDILVGKSQEILRTDLVDMDYDFIYIDGSHTAKDVLEDAVLAFRLLKQGGIMIFDDYMWDKNSDPKLNPKMAIDAFLAMFEGDYKLIGKEYQVCIEKI